jgi:predicted nucleic acid-binding protein
VITLDASVMIAALKRTHPHHRPAVRIFESDTRFMVHTVTMAEVLAGGARVAQADAMLETLIGLGVLESDRVRGEAMTLAHLRSETPLRMPDCCVLLVAENQGGSLATFDDRLARVARSRGVTVIDGRADGGD